MKYKNIFAVVLCICILCTLSFSVYAQNVGDVFYYDSYLPEPTVTENCKTFVFLPSSSNTSGVPTMFIFYGDPEYNTNFEVFIYINSSGNWQYSINYDVDQGPSYNEGQPINPSINSYKCVMLMYNAVTGEYLGGNYNVQYATIYTTSRNKTSWDKYLNYGCNLSYLNYDNNASNISLGHMQWAYAVEDEWFAYLINTSLSDMLQRLNSIDSSTQSLDYDFYNFLQLFTQYQSWIRTTYYSEIKTQTALLGSIETYLSSISYQLNQLYILLGGGQQVPTVPPENDSFIDEYNSLENNLMTDYQSDAAAVFSNSNNISSFSNAIQFLSVSLQQIILNNAKLNTLILFTLGIGIAVLIIGRKINT